MRFVDVLTVRDPAKETRDREIPELVGTHA